MPGGARDSDTFHLLLIPTLTGTGLGKLQAGDPADRDPQPKTMASHPAASDRAAKADVAHRQGRRSPEEPERTTYATSAKPGRSDRGRRVGVFHAATAGVKRGQPAAEQAKKTS